MSNIFRYGKVNLSSGEESNYKIDCDYLTDDDIEFFARLIAQNIKFKKVWGIPTGGTRLAKALLKYCVIDHHAPCIMVDDVMTTGNSFEKAKKEFEKSEILRFTDLVGVCIFCRNLSKKPDWVKSIFDVSDFEM